MAYGNPYATYNNPYQPYSPPVGYIPTPQPQPDSNIIWVKGDAGANAYPLQNGKSAILFDSDSERFFIKTVDISGMPQPLRVFNYSESTKQDMKPAQQDTSNFVTKQELEDILSRLQNGQYVRKDKQNNGKPSVQ